MPTAAQTGAHRAALVVPVGGMALDLMDLVRAENPEQAFAMTLEPAGGVTLVPEGSAIAFWITSERTGYLTLLTRDEGGTITVLYPNRYARDRVIPAGERVLIGDEFNITARAPFGREVVRALITPTPLIDAEAGARAWLRRAAIRVDGPPPTDAGTDLGGYNPALWGSSGLVLTTMRTRATGAPPVPPPPPPSAYRPQAPLAAWQDRYQDLTSAPFQIKTWGMFTPTDEPAHDGSLVVVYRPSTGWRSFGRPAGGGGLFGRVRYVIPGADARDASGTRSLHRDVGASFEDVLEGLNDDPDVVAAVPNYQFRSLGWRSEIQPAPKPKRGETPDYWDVQWALHNPFFRSEAERLDIAWRDAFEHYRTPDRPVVVAVLDTGIRFDNPHLGPILWRNSLEIAENGIDDDGNGFVDDVRGWDTIDDDGDPTDPSADESHGTFVASQIGGVGASIQAMAPDVRILPVRVLDAEGSGSLRQLIEGVRYAAQNGARVANLSFGMAPMAEPNPRLERVLETLFAEADRLGVLLVIAAGNHGADGRTSVTYPAHVRAANTITTGALTMTGELAEFSNRGPDVDVVAPGQAIISHPGRGSEVAAFDGTSMAAPFVAGLAAMLIAQHPTWTPAEVRAAIVETVRPIPELDVATGGLINAAAALGRDEE